MFGIDDAALATILAGMVSTAGSLYTNKKNRDAQAEANAINWEIARQNNATQIEMANTAHQREVRDLRKAGLNPILSAGGNGSSVPSLQSPTLNPVHTDNAFEGLANSAKGLGRYMSQEYKAQVANSQAMARLADNDAKLAANEYGAQAIAAENDLYLNNLRNTALREEFGIHNMSFDNDEGGVVSVIDDDKAYRKAVDTMREGIRSDLRDAASSWWRNDIQAIGSGINSAGGLINALRPRPSRVNVQRR